MITLNENDYGIKLLKFEKESGHKKKFPPSFRGKYELSQRTVDLLRSLTSGDPMTSRQIAASSGYKVKDVQNSLYQARAAGLVHTTLVGGIARWVSGPKPRVAQL